MGLKPVLAIVAASLGEIAVLAVGRPLALAPLSVTMLVPLLSYAQPAAPPPGPPFHGPPPPDARRVAPLASELRLRLQHTVAVNPVAQRALDLSKTYFDRAEKALARNEYFAADRLLSASESLRRVASFQNPENQAELREPPRPPFAGRGPGGGFGPGPPRNGPRGPLSGDPMEHLYFRLRQADFFAAQSKDPTAPGLAQWAREFYQQARQAAEHAEPENVMLNARSAGEIVHALESLAQAAAPFPPPGMGPSGRRPDGRGPGGHGPPPPPGAPPGGGDPGQGLQP